MGSSGVEKIRFLFGLVLWSFIVFSPEKVTGDKVIDSGDTSFKGLNLEPRTVNNYVEETKLESNPVDIPKRISIEKLSLDVPIAVVGFTAQKKWIVPDDLPATARQELKVGGGKNVSIWGHREKIFARLGELEIGDEISVFDERGGHLYKVTGKFIVSPKDVWVMNPTPDYNLTLITCDPPNSRESRLIIRAKPVEAV